MAVTACCADCSITFQQNQIGPKRSVCRSCEKERRREKWRVKTRPATTQCVECSADVAQRPRGKLAKRCTACTRRHDTKTGNACRRLRRPDCRPRICKAGACQTPLIQPNTGIIRYCVIHRKRKRPTHCLDCQSPLPPTAGKGNRRFCRTCAAIRSRYAARRYAERNPLTPEERERRRIYLVERHRKKTKNAVRPGFVYLITDGTGLVKIGRSTASSFAQRFKSIQTGNGRLLTLEARRASTNACLLEADLLQATRTGATDVGNEWRIISAVSPILESWLREAQCAGELL
jgi:hypothetical protein